MDDLRRLDLQQLASGEKNAWVGFLHSARFDLVSAHDDFGNQLTRFDGLDFGMLYL
eukprot:CAMPEP_0195012002 /NCGR_PEP_ID=MMETSP0326_2-20130528/11453_1 /TAXON_ID=2866 ORGANISM="Crypthecodinium cohnii, Strain Seligo" /NCGR_SAMPLE_ID=MMETSP0326_2 /ASSEMBLY_ACC=CAM_ASM_000348 /LENGTH=55 /DNA_ID=CAMNT_0040021423 /DNA_START=289 /DNA_END=456 /DNA_ORIENTATION=+